MKKLDDIMELLTEEIDGFNKSITKLEKLSENIRNTRITADSSGIETMMNNYINREEVTSIYYKKQLEEINKKLKWGKVLLILFCITSGITVLTMGYFGYQNIKLENEKEIYYSEGKEETMGQFQGYFNEYPEAYEDYNLWLKKQSPAANKE